MIRTEFRTIRTMALPIVATQVATMMLGVCDMLMLGHYDTRALAASALGRVWIFGTFVMAQGVLFGQDPRISQLHGAGKTKELGTTLQGGLILCAILSIPLALAWMFTSNVLGGLGVDPELAELAGRYAVVQIPGIPFLLGFHALRSWLQGRGIMRPAMWVVFVANGLNVIVNWALIFGHLGFEPHGLVGAGCATAFTQIFMLLGLLLFVRVFDLHKDAWTRWSRAAWREVVAIARMGGPIGLQFGFEIWAFKAATLMAEKLGTEAVASHAIVLSLASISFMVPLGISIAASARVGNLIGARKFGDAQTASTAALILGVSSMMVFAILFIVLRDELPRLFNPDPLVVAGAAAILPVAAAFQLFDGLQVVAGGVIRGMGRTRILASVHFIAFYVFGLPLAYYLGVAGDQGLRGIWWGLCLGLAGVSVVLLVWVSKRGPASMEGAAPTVSV
ncbi:MAG: MATE family multidrug resistance protein [Candidatus Paceibacteria bacterium]|jgi:MATE family multidrug resistance protein